MHNILCNNIKQTGHAIAKTIQKIINTCCTIAWYANIHLSTTNNQQCFERYNI